MGLSLKGEVASSAITTDKTAEQVNTSRSSLGFIPRVSSSYYRALNGSAQYRFSNYSFGVAYERVDPGYQTLGAYYFNNDLESISLTHTSSWLQQKISINTRWGLQRNNLDNDELSTLRRFSTAVSVNVQINQRLVTAFSYSNFSTVVNFQSIADQIDQVTPYNQLDTLNYRQVSQNGSSNLNYVLNPDKERRQNLSLNVSYQATNDLRNGHEQNSGSRFYHVNTAYTYALANLGLTINLAGNANLQRSTTADSFIFGPSSSIRKSLLDNTLASNLTFSYNTSKSNGLLVARVINLRLGGTYTLKEVHHFSLNMTSVNRFSPQNETAPRFKEWVTELGYSYNFKMR